MAKIDQVICYFIRGNSANKAKYGVSNIFIMRSEVCFLQLRKFLTSENKYDIEKPTRTWKETVKLANCLRHEKTQVSKVRMILVLHLITW